MCSAVYIETGAYVGVDGTKDLYEWHFPCTRRLYYNRYIPSPAGRFSGKKNPRSTFFFLSSNTRALHVIYTRTNSSHFRIQINTYIYIISLGCIYVPIYIYIDMYTIYTIYTYISAVYNHIPMLYIYAIIYITAAVYQNYCTILQLYYVQLFCIYTINNYTIYNNTFNS